jgi:uncharacterized protein (TIGR02246 family)
MQKPVAGWLVIVSIVLALGCVATEPQPPMVDAAAIRATIDSLNQTFNAAVAARDTEAVVSYFAADAQVLPSNGPRVQGRDAVRQLWVGFLSLPGLDLNIRSSNVTVSESGDMVVDVGDYTLRGQDPTGQPFDDVGKYATVFKKTEGAWKIIVDIWNSDRPLPGMGG